MAGRNRRGVTVRIDGPNCVPVAVNVMVCPVVVGNGYRAPAAFNLIVDGVREAGVDT